MQNQMHTLLLTKCILLSLLHWVSLQSTIEYSSYEYLSCLGDVASAYGFFYALESQEYQD